MTGENENNGGAAERLAGDNNSDAPLTDAQLHDLARHYPDAVEQYRQRQAGQGSRDEPQHAPGTVRGGAPTTAEATAELTRLRSDPEHLAKISGRHGAREREAALDLVDGLARQASATDEADKQAAADAAMDPRSPSDYRNFDLPGGHAWSDEARDELVSFKQELHQAGVSPQVASTLFQEYGSYIRMDDETHFASVERAVGQLKALPDGERMFADVQRFVRSTKSQPMQEAIMVAGMSVMGLREIARLGRRMGRA